jgi:hypothetical protein
MAAKIVEAPFTPEQVENLNRFQWLAPVHPFTCPQCHVTDQVLFDLRLVALESGWRCPNRYCDYQQDWAHDFMAEARTW